MKNPEAVTPTSGGFFAAQILFKSFSVTELQEFHATFINFRNRSGC